MTARKFVDLENKVKECSRCGAVKSFDEFSPSKRPGRRGGVLSICRQCTQDAKIPNRKRPYRRHPRCFVDIENRLKECIQCRMVFSFDDFYASEATLRFRGGVLGRCNNCRASYCRERKLRNVYGLTPDQHQSMLDAQNGACAICKQAMDSPHVDHCHATGKVRGLLCQKCNNGIGLLGDSVERVDAAAAYLRLHGAT